MRSKSYRIDDLGKDNDTIGIRLLRELLLSYFNRILPPVKIKCVVFIPAYQDRDIKYK